MTWQPIETIPKDGRTVEVRGSMRVHYFGGAKFETMPESWRPDTPRAEWLLLEWREVPAPSRTAAAVSSACARPGSA